jgi:hypothetical protein
MTIVALSWPAAFIGSVTVAVVGLVLSVISWQILKTGRAGMRQDRR